MSRRTERLGHLIRNIVGQTILQKLSDPRIPPLTSVTRVDVAPDLSVAKIYVSVFAPPGKQSACLMALHSAMGRLRSAIAAGAQVRTVPELIFRLDDTIQRSAETVELIESAMRELGEPPDWERPRPTANDDAMTTPAPGENGEDATP
ncbi:MAG: 30S ribosome-binding factor RbfA [Phycisphaerales bacterium]|nr:30S ribosome-binding factor RbfA [Phycisphaerales bacterium]